MIGPKIYELTVHNHVVMPEGMANMLLSVHMMSCWFLYICLSLCRAGYSIEERIDRMPLASLPLAEVFEHVVKEMETLPAGDASAVLLEQKVSVAEPFLLTE